jgi:hypothetical protein
MFVFYLIGKRRRKEGGFLGAEHVIPQIKGGVERRRIGLIVEGAPARGIFYNFFLVFVDNINTDCLIQKMLKFITKMS